MVAWKSFTVSFQCEYMQIIQLKIGYTNITQTCRECGLSFLFIQSFVGWLAGITVDRVFFIVTNSKFKNECQQTSFFHLRSLLCMHQMRCSESRFSFRKIGYLDTRSDYVYILASSNDATKNTMASTTNSQNRQFI